MRGGMSPAAAAAKKRLGVGGGFALGCGCKDAKAVAVASASPYSATATEASTATTTTTWRSRARAAHPSASGSTGTLTVPSASSSSFPWEDAEVVDGDGEEVSCKRESSTANTPSFSGLLRQLNELEQSVVSWGRKSTSKSHLSPPPPPPPPPPLSSSRPAVKPRAVHSGDRRVDNKEGHGANFSPPPPPPPPPSFQFQTQQLRKEKIMDKGDRQEAAVLYITQPPPSSEPAPAPPTTSLPSPQDQPRKSVVSWGRKSTSKSHLSPPPPPPPPPLPSRPVAKQRAVHSGDRRDSKEGHGANFSPPSFQFQTQQLRKTKIMDKGDDRQEAAVLFITQQPPPAPAPPTTSLPLPQDQPRNTKSTEKAGSKKEDASNNKSPLRPQPQAPKKHRKAKSFDGCGRLDGTVAVVKQSDDPLSDFRRSMVNMIVENRIATGDELRELLRHFLALNAPHHHDAILRAFTEIWDEAFSATKAAAPRRESPVRRPTPPRQRTPPPQRRRQAPSRAWR